MTRYYGVVSNRDYIKINGQKRPFWEFLDHEPEGWLCSLAYVRDDPPHHLPCLWDCGAWSYRDKEIPKIKRNLVTATWAFEQYTLLAQPGDLVVAPDHMLIPNTDHAARRRFNQESAAQFIAHTQGTGLIPMACIHGTTVDERVTHARELCAMGYEHLALGGLAGRASQKRVVLEIVAVSYTHLGLSDDAGMRHYQARAFQVSVASDRCARPDSHLAGSPAPDSLAKTAGRPGRYESMSCLLYTSRCV